MVATLVSLSTYFHLFHNSYGDDCGGLLLSDFPTPYLLYSERFKSAVCEDPQ